MKNKFLKTIGYLAVSLALTACSSEDMVDSNERPEGKYPLIFTATGLEVTPVTRATAEGEWNTGDEVAVQVENGSVKKYKPSSNGTSVTLTATDPFYWQSTSDINVTAWYFGAGYQPSLPDSWGVNSNQDSEDNYWKCDVLYAHGTLSFNGSRSLRFYHQVAKVVVHVLKGNDTPENLRITELIAKNLYLKCKSWTAPIEKNVYGTVTERDGKSEISSLLFNAGEITLPDKSKTTPLASYKFLIVPQDVNNGTPLFTITAQGYDAPFIYTPTSSRTLEAGNEYTYYITIKGSKVITTVSTANISWGETSGGTGEGSVDI